MAGTSKLTITEPQRRCPSNHCHTVVMAKRMMPGEHKAAIAASRLETAAVSGCLETLDAQRPKRGRQVAPERFQARRADIDAQLTAGDLKPIKRLELMQDRRDLEEHLNALANEPAMSAVEQAFIEHAASFGARRGIAYATWHEVGVPAELLGRAGITRDS